MSMVRATVKMYADAAGQATRAMGRSVVALPLLLLGYLTLTFAEMYFFSRIPGTAGFVAGFIHALLEAAVVGTYLSLVESVVLGRRRLRLDDLRDHLGNYLWDVISVLFIFWIASLLLGLVAPPLVAVLVPLAIIAFNPAPELIYQGRTRSLELLGEALRFMQRNWPEWLGAQIPAILFLAGFSVLVTGGLSVPVVVDSVQAFGPFFGFVRLGGDALRIAFAGVGGGPAVVGAIALLAFTHWFMLWRGYLFRELSSGSRRARAWRARM